MNPLPASDASTLGYLAEFPDVDEGDKQKLLAALSPAGREIADALLDESAEATPEAKQKAAALKEWAVAESALR